MSKVLYIKSNIKPEGESRTYKVADSFIEEYKLNNPNDEVIVLDLYKEDIDFLRGKDLAELFGAKDENSKNNPILKYAYQFAEADKYIIAAPMWNLSIPAILKAYIDYISVAGITFKYTAEGAVGLCTGKKAVLVTSRGGVYSEGPAEAFEMGERYLKVILAFFGIADIQTIAVEGVDVMGADIDKIVSEEITKAKNIAKEF